MGETRRIKELYNHFNAVAGELEVQVFSNDLHDFVVTTEPDDNPGASITNAAENYCPQLAERLNLNWSRCIFIESYPALENLGEIDPSFDRIYFKAEIYNLYNTGLRKYVPTAKLLKPGWRLLSPDLAKSLRESGLVMSQVIGKEVLYRSDDSSEPRRGQVMNYDGRRYYVDEEVISYRNIVRVFHAGAN